MLPLCGSDEFLERFGGKACARDRGKVSNIGNGFSYDLLLCGIRKMLLVPRGYFGGAGGYFQIGYYSIRYGYGKLDALVPVRRGIGNGLVRGKTDVFIYRGAG